MEPTYPANKKLAPARLSAWLTLGLGVAALLAEFLNFDQIGARRHTWIYPRWNDQIQYLTESYQGYEYLKTHGFFPGLWATLVNPSAQGTLHDFFAVAIFTVTGPSRSAALSLNLLALIAWQVALAYAVWRHSGSRWLAWAAAALPLALSWPWNNWAGSTIDFRLDHLGMCALGVTAAAAWLTDGFRSTRWSAGLGLAIGVTLLTRFITGPYFVVMAVAMAVWLVCTPERFPRLGRLLLAGLIAAAMAGPVFWINRAFVWNYYWIGHFTGPESAIRNPNMGLGRSIAFVWNGVIRQHLGTPFLLIAGAGVLLLAAGMKRRITPHAPRSDATARARWILSATFLLAPALVLTLHQQKSEIVLGALVPGAVSLILAAWCALHARRRGAWSERLLALGVVIACGGFFVARQLAPAYDAGFAADARKVNDLADYLYRQTHITHLQNPRIGVDRVTDCLDAQIMRVICYERKHEWMPFAMTLPTGIWKEKEDVLFERLAQSDFVFITESSPAEPVGWPYDQQLRELRPRTQAWCESHLQLVERFPLFGYHMALYQRREIPLFDPSQK